MAMTIFEEFAKFLPEEAFEKVKSGEWNLDEFNVWCGEQRCKAYQDGLDDALDY